MARVQKVQPKKKNTNQASQKNAKSKTELAKTNPKREATKKGHEDLKALLCYDPI
jgi:hypothetical protein